MAIANNVRRGSSELPLSFRIVGKAEGFRGVALVWP